MREQGETGRGLMAFIKERGRMWLLLGCGLLGVLLLLFGGGGAKEAEADASDVIELRVAELAAYEEKLEGEIKELCEAVAGVRDADVMISFSGSYSISYVEERDGTPVTVGTGSSEEALFRYLSPPTVRGVGIVCRGGQRADVQQQLTELISTALGIPSSYVYITGK